MKPGCCFQLLAVALMGLTCGAPQAPSPERSQASEVGAPEGALAPGSEDYASCSEAIPCADAGECVLGLCLPTCHGGAACREGEICWEDGCLNSCDAEHSCAQAFSCEEGTCVDDPCGHPEFWSFSLASDTYPILVHYRDSSELPMAEEVLRLTERSWQVETEALGFEPPLPDEGLCGPDDRFDVFIWRSYRGGTGDVIAPNESTPWDDYYAYLILDPWGPYGGERLDATVCHELNHAIQARYDWWESPIFFEMTSQFIEEQVFDDDNGYRDFLFDFQSHPDWSFDFDDEYETWYMYGSMLYLLYLQQAVFSGEAEFIADLWRSCADGPDENEPDFEDALEGLLTERASRSFLDTVEEFSRWRYFTASRDDGRHFEEGASFPEAALVAIEREIPAEPGVHRFEPGPMMLGVHYVTLTTPEDGTGEIILGFDGDIGARWSIQLVPGLEPGSDGETLNLSGAEQTVAVSFGDLPARTLVILALPVGLDDPDGRGEERFPYTLTLSAATGGDRLQHPVP